jgi:hypothetical protein
MSEFLGFPGCTFDPDDVEPLSADFYGDAASYVRNENMRIWRRDDMPTALGVAMDPVNHPAHYTSHPSGVECITVTEHMGFNLGNAVKYIWRADLKGNGLEDLRKARWYIEREIARREGAKNAG